MQTALITGGASGIGKATAEFLIERGWCVFAADLNEKDLKALPPAIFPMYMDVTNITSIARCLEVVEHETDGLDAVINCAGILVVGSMVEVTEDDMVRIIDVNLLGAYRVNRYFFPQVLKRGGRIIIMSSEVGVQTTFPLNGPYAITKHGIEAYSDALRRELSFLDIKVIKIRPGAVQTSMVESVGKLFRNASLSSNYFSDLIAKNIDFVSEVTNKAIDPKNVAKTIHLALTTKRPQASYAIKPDPRRTLLSHFPPLIADHLIKWILSK